MPEQGKFDIAYMSSSELHTQESVREITAKIRNELVLPLNLLGKYKVTGEIEDEESKKAVDCIRRIDKLLTQISDSHK